MTELNQCQTRDGKVVYSARELHTYLGSKSDFTSWFKYQVENCNLIEGDDYSYFSPKFGEYSGIKKK
jgi:anti-repressor protein